MFNGKLEMISKDFSAARGFFRTSFVLLVCNVHCNNYAAIMLMVVAGL